MPRISDRLQGSLGMEIEESSAPKKIKFWKVSSKTVKSTNPWSTNQDPKVTTFQQTSVQTWSKAGSATLFPKWNKECPIWLQTTRSSPKHRIKFWVATKKPLNLKTIYNLPFEFNIIKMLVLTEEQIFRCQKVWQELVGLEQIKIDVFKLKDCLEAMEVEFQHINVFYKLLSELNIDQSHEITFDVFLNIYQYHMQRRNS